MSTERKKKTPWQGALMFVLVLLLSFAGGFFVGAETDGYYPEGAEMWQTLLISAAMLGILYVALVIQLIIHEGGHLVFGLITGYGFSSFRIFSFMLLKGDDGRLQLKRFSLAGTAGQCLMTPPDIKDGKMPVVLYNLGGSIANVVFSVLFLVLYLFLPHIPYLSLFLLFLAIVGLALALMNGIPLSTASINNDGYNALALLKNDRACRAFWIQMKANELQSKGVRLKDMPAEWFEVPTDEEMKNAMIAPIGVFAASRLMDEGRLYEAESLMEHLMNIESGIVPLHRALMVCDRIYIELISSNRSNVIEGYLTTAQKKFMKSMRSFPSVIRTDYAYAALHMGDEAMAKSRLSDFEKCAKTYPYPQDIVSERELIELVKEHS